MDKAMLNKVLNALSLELPEAVYNKAIPMIRQYASTLESTNAALTEQLATRTAERDAAIKQIAQNGIEWGHREAELIAERDQLLPCAEACREFVHKVECGEARSKRSYAQMKDVIAKLDRAKEGK